MLRSEEQHLNDYGGYTKKLEYAVDKVEAELAELNTQLRAASQEGRPGGEIEMWRSERSRLREELLRLDQETGDDDTLEDEHAKNGSRPILGHKRNLAESPNSGTSDFGDLDDRGPATVDADVEEGTTEGESTQTDGDRKVSAAQEWLGQFHTADDAADGQHVLGPDEAPGLQNA